MVVLRAVLAASWVVLRPPGLVLGSVLAPFWHPRWVQKPTQDRGKTVLTALATVNSPQDRFKSSQDLPRAPQDHPKSPKRPPRRPKMTQKDPHRRTQGQSKNKDKDEDKDETKQRQDKDKEKMTEEDQHNTSKTNKAQQHKHHTDRRNDEGGDEAQLTVYRRCQVRGQ